MKQFGVKGILKNEKNKAWKQRKTHLISLEQQKILKSTKINDKAKFDYCFIFFFFLDLFLTTPPFYYTLAFGLFSTSLHQQLSWMDTTGKMGIFTVIITHPLPWTFVAYSIFILINLKIILRISWIHAIISPWKYIVTIIAMITYPC